MTTSFWLLRHPEPQPEARGRCYGALDVPLSPGGFQEASRVAGFLHEEPLSAIYASPRRRCQDAALILAGGHGCCPVTLDALREIDFGEFEGRSYDEIAASHPDLYRQWMDHPTEIQFPGGESFAQMRERVVEAANALRRRHDGETIAIVTHGGVIRILVADALSIPHANIFRIAQRYAAINLIRYLDGIPSVELLNAQSIPVGCESQGR